jgi:tetratricopeptide (TPR) repeat protein
VLGSTFHWEAIAMARRALLAIAVLTAVVGCSKTEVPTNLTDLALRQLRSGEYDEAIKTSSQAIAEKPEAAAYLYRGRAYHYRNAMGDHQRAVADFTEAIRLDPKSSDAYYFRAEARRDLGQKELADADESTARNLDHVVQDTYRRMPDVTTPPDVATPSDVATSANGKKGKSSAGVSQSEAEQKRVYEELKDRFEPGFGELRTLGGPAAGGAAAKSSGSYNDRYRQLLEQANREQAPQQSAAPLDARESSATPGLSGSGLPSASPQAPGSAAPGNAARRGAARPGTWEGPMQPSLTSPFSQRTSVSPSGQLGPRVNPNVQSPFQQPVRSGTGFTPVTPFGAQAQQQAAPVARPFGNSTTNRFSNPSVRPANPRDYVP